MIILVEKVTKIAAIACNLKKTSKKWDFLTYDSNKGVKISWNICFLIPFLTLSQIYMYKLVNKIQIGHSELLKLGKKLILRKTLIFIIFGLLFLDFRFYIDYDVIWVKIVHKHKPIYANYWFQWQKKYNIAKKNYEIVLHPMHGGGCPWVQFKFRHASTLGEGHLGQRWRIWDTMSTHNNFSEKKSTSLNPMTLNLLGQHNIYV